jgi:hypothetical protein
MIKFAVFLMLISTPLLGEESVLTPNAQCQQLADTLLPFAEKMLSGAGEFYPFGALMKTDGKIVQAGAYNGKEQPTSQQLLDLLRGAFRAQAAKGAIIASAVAFDVRVVPPGGTEKMDAVEIELDHRDNYSVIVFFPYVIEHGSVQFCPAFANKGSNGIFNHAAN